jgi:hypothetical protein
VLDTGNEITHQNARLKSQFLNQSITIWIDDLNPKDWDLKSLIAHAISIYRLW